MKKPFPWYSDTRSGGGWFVKLSGDQNFLGKHPDNAPPPKKGKDGWSEGRFKVERLVNMAKHNYKTEPNVTITPDGKWVVFRSNMHGPTHVYAVEVKKST